MIQVKHRIHKLRNSNILVNGMWLYVLQIFNTVIPLLTLPYITRILGPSQYGVFSAALNIVGYSLVVVEYGFNLSGVRKVALAKNQDQISEIYTRITLSKLCLSGITLVVMIFLSLFLNITRAQFICMAILYTMVLGGAIQQNWLFQGLQTMKYITLVSVFSRIISVILIFLLVNNDRDLFLYCGLYSLTFLLMGIISILMTKLKLNIHFVKIKLIDIYNELKDGWYLFTTSAMTKIFSGLGITVLIFSDTDSSVGIYSAIQKIPLIISMLYAPIGQIIYPNVSKHYESSFDSGMKKVKKVCLVILPTTGIVGLILILSSKLVIDILYGAEYSIHSQVLVPLILWVMLSILNNLLGIQILVASGHLREYSFSFRIGLVAIILFNIAFGVLGGMLGVAIAAMLAELALTIAIIFQIQKIKRNNGVQLHKI